MLIQCCITSRVEQLGVTEVGGDGPNTGVCLCTLCGLGRNYFTSMILRPLDS